MISSGAKRSILRWIHLVFVIPTLGYIYEPASEVQQYAGGVRFIFLPVLMFSGYWMYAGLIFAVIGVALWLGLYQLYGFGAAILGQIALFIARNIWFAVRARNQSAA